MHTHIHAHKIFSQERVTIRMSEAKRGNLERCVNILFYNRKTEIKSNQTRVMSL